MFWKEIFIVFLLNNEKTDGNPPLAPVSNKEFIPFLFLISVRQFSVLKGLKSIYFNSPDYIIAGGSIVLSVLCLQNMVLKMKN